ncbi:hypothetical protein RDI58_024441 [Solanum bulbocastanum]|uniref:Uncharacterized protein n=1 Tax=Solanum bulbocastanum TaxID=147425 RepID=A0AAN8SXP8_SOLBU
MKLSGKYAMKKMDNPTICFVFIPSSSTNDSPPSKSSETPPPMVVDASCRVKATIDPTLKDIQRYTTLVVETTFP